MAACDAAARLYAYLLGHWSLVKRVEYRRGGDYGTWRGDAVFEPICETDHLLELVESGEFFFDRNPECGVGTLAKPLKFDLRRSPIEVLFADDVPRLFYSFDPASLISAAGEEPGESRFRHLCGPDIYQGSMRICDAHHFRITWTVSGPSKDGVVRQDYTRSARETEGFDSKAE